MPSWEMMCSAAQTSCDCEGKFFTAVILVFPFLNSSSNAGEVLEAVEGQVYVCCVFSSSAL